MKNLITSKWKAGFLVILFVLGICGTAIATGTGLTVNYGGMSITELQNKIATLGLGLGTYVVGKKMTPEQQAVAEKSSDYKSYPGTVKFKDQDIFVIADQETKVVIALYVRNKQATQDDFKAMVGGLMMRFGEPTVEAHGKTIYWNYAADGLLSEELYRSVKEKGLLETLGVLATVKFSSSQNLDELFLKEKEEKDKKLDNEKVQVTSDNYVMIQSDVLTRKYMGN